MKRAVWLAQVNNRYGTSLFLPYSAGCLWAYAQQSEQVRKSYRLGGFLIEREPVHEALSRVLADPPSVFGVSCYIWNFNYSMVLARAVSAALPRCLVIAGGPHIPEHVPADFFLRHPYLDMVAHHEGEIPFTRILEEALGERPRFSQVPAVTVSPVFEWEPESEVGTGTRQKAARLPSLDALPSPYLTGVFDALMRDPRYADTQWDATQETHRGCPYACSFCDWGGAVFTKVRKRPDEVIRAEYNWMAAHRINLLYNADANYGLFERDVVLTEQLVEMKRRTGYPREFRAAYAKNSNDRVFNLARTLNDAGMCKGVTLSFQSMDTHTLQAIKRKNMAVNDFGVLIARYREAGIPTYTELILGLPEETYDSFADGINTLLKAGQHDSLNVYPCMILPNAEMADPVYRAKHGIKTRRIPDLLTHSVPSNDPHPEEKEIVVGTSSMSTLAWQRAYIFGCIIQAFHSMGLTQQVARFLNERGMSYREFYEGLIETNEEPVRTAVKIARKATDRVLAGGSWDVVLPKWGSVSWTPEEAVFLTTLLDRASLSLLMRKLLRTFLSIDWDVGDSLLGLQWASVCDPWMGKQGNMNLHVDLLGFTAGHYQVEHYDEYRGDYERYAREIVWYGRKASRMRPVRIERIGQ